MAAPERQGWAIYLTGLPSSGKTTLAHALGEILAGRGIRVQILDSDRMRRILTPDPTYSAAERDWFYEALAFIAGLLTQNGVHVIIAATAPRRAHRVAARSRIDRFAEVYLDCPIDVCRARDPKGLWARAATGEVTDLPGAGAPYEPPESAEASVDTGKLSPRGAARAVAEQLDRQGFFGDGS
jgi:adenylylsulfate kinase